MDAKTIVDLLEPLIGSSDRIAGIYFRSNSHSYISNSQYGRKVTDDPITIAAILSVIERDGLVQFDTAEETHLFDPADVSMIKIASLAAINRVAG